MLLCVSSRSDSKYRDKTKRRIEDGGAFKELVRTQALEGVKNIPSAKQLLCLRLFSPSYHIINTQYDSSLCWAKNANQITYFNQDLSYEQAKK